MQLRYSCYLNNTGYSIAAQEYISAIRRVQPYKNIKLIAVNGFKNRPGISGDRQKWFTELRNTPAESKYISVQHCIPRIYISDKAKKRVGVAVYETIDPPTGWITRMNEMDHIITASHFNKGVFESTGLRRPSTVVPHCFDSELFHREVVPDGRYNLFTFMYIGTWKERKNFPALIKAFYDGFDLQDQVCLILKSDKPKQMKDTINAIKNDGWKTKQTAPVYVLEEVVPFEKIPKLMKKADVYISPSLGEGFGYGGLHAMALNIPLITVKYGGCLEYAKPDLCTYINPHGYQTRLNMDGLPQFHNKIWPQIKISEIRNKMRYVYESQKEVQEKAEAAYRYAHQHFNYEIVGRRFLSVIKDLEHAG